MGEREREIRRKSRAGDRVTVSAVSFRSTELIHMADLTSRSRN